MVGGAPSLCTVWQICNRCTGFVDMTTAANAKCQRVLVLALCLVAFGEFCCRFVYRQSKNDQVKIADRVVCGRALVANRVDVKTAKFHSVLEQNTTDPQCHQSSLGSAATGAQNNMKITCRV